MNDADRILHTQPLTAEESTNYSIGAVIRLGGLNVTVDGYRIEIDDRIVLSENLTQANVRTFLQAQGFIGAGGGRFFINGVDTETQDDTGYTEIMRAARAGSWPTVELLLSHAARTDHVGNDGRTLRDLLTEAIAQSHGALPAPIASLQASLR